MSVAVRNPGSWTQRFLVWIFTFALGLLLFWLIGFVLGDIGTWPGPDYQALEQALIEPGLLTQSKELATRLDETKRTIERETSRQQVLSDSTAEAQRTMGQLLDFQRLAIEKGVTPSAEEQQALAESQSLFLANQRQYQELNQQIGRLESERGALEEQQRVLEEQITHAREPVQQEFDRQWEQHRWKIAATKLGVMVPLVIVASVLFLKGRSSLYAPLIYAFGAAVVLRTGLVMHEYFPERWFKYILIGTSLVVVLRALTYLVRSIAHPKVDSLVRQYREAYERFLCPICEYPIRRGPLKYLVWTWRSAKHLPQAAASTPQTETPYTCPMCATRLFEECPHCHAIRHALLPACEHCGTTHAIEAPASAQLA